MTRATGDTHPSTSGHGTPDGRACSVLWDDDGTSAFGTAARAGFFVLLEQPGPWGRDAARDSHLDPQVGAELDARCGAAGGRFMLIRRPGGHPARDRPHRVLVAWTGGGTSARGSSGPVAPWLLGADLAHPGELLTMDWAALSRGSRSLVAASLPSAEEVAPTLLVCTNGRRDVCCAVRGRPLAAAAARLAPGRAWEVSHTGGHRFAPTAVLLPWGQTYARLDEESVEWVLGAALSGHTPLELLGATHDRGRAPLSPDAQCAESFVREQLGETALRALSTAEVEADGLDDRTTAAVVSHEDGRTWLVHVRWEQAGLSRPESCGKKPVPVVTRQATVVSAT
ncbi:MAG: sucrase ferredoxin [Terracoccus sp.]